MMLISFLFFFVLFTGVGVASSLWRRNTIDDYFLASRDIPAWLVALSFGATISSGATFIGFAGLAYSTGIKAVFVVGALTIGDHIGWILSGNKIRQRATERKAHTYPSLIGKLGDKDQPIVTFIAALLTIVFLGTYCAAQLVAGAKIGETLFDWDYTFFIILGALVLLAYCWSGGIRASIWTDAVQAILIMVSLIVLIAAAIFEIGGFGALWAELHAIDPNLINPFQLSFISLAFAWICFGMGILGQPQLMVRHMVARSDKDLLTARRIYLSWRWIVLMLSCLSGMVARVLIPSTEGVAFDAELSIPLLWQDLLPPVLVGLLIAGLFSSTMSTADSLLLAASSSLTQNVLPKWRDSYAFARLGTIFVILLIVTIALIAGKQVLPLIVLAWGYMAAALTPAIIVQLLGFRPSQRLVITMMISGFAMYAFWQHGLVLNKTLLSIVPSMGVAFTVFAIGYPLERKSRTQSPDHVAAE